MKRDVRLTILVALAAVLALALTVGPPVEARDFGEDGRQRPVKLERHLAEELEYDGDGDDDGEGDDDGDRDDDGECVVICHKPGTPAEQTKCVDRPAVRAHLRHGDHLGACEPPQPDGETILEILVRTDGAQALVATVLVVDEALGSGIADLLNDPRANWVLFAPGNGAFEDLLLLEEGDLDGLSIAAIAQALPGILGKLGVTPEQVRDILVKHLAANPGDRRRGSEDGLLRRGEITVVDMSVFPISVGRSSVAVNYESEFTKPDVFAVNGVIHFVDTVILDAPPPADVVQVFVTSERFTGDLGGLSAADDLCTAAAEAADLGGDWTAWLSDGSTNARDRILDAEYQLLDGTLVATSLADLTDGSLVAPINVDENGATVDGNPWTGTESDGTGGADNCGDWADGTNAGSGIQGDTESATATWTRLGSTAPCDFQRGLYCFAGAVVPGVPDETNVCSQELCVADPDLAAECEDFLSICLPNEPTEDCIGAAILICREPI
jgi:hypothetical protein